MISLFKKVIFSFKSRWFSRLYRGSFHQSSPLSPHPPNKKKLQWGEWDVRVCNYHSYIIWFIEPHSNLSFRHPTSCTIEIYIQKNPQKQDTNTRKQFLTRVMMMTKNKWITVMIIYDFMITTLTIPCFPVSKNPSPPDFSPSDSSRYLLPKLPRWKRVAAPWEMPQTQWLLKGSWKATNRIEPQNLKWLLYHDFRSKT